MLLTTILNIIQNRQEKEKIFLYLERYVNEPIKDFNLLSKVNIKYSPQKGEDFFYLPYKNCNANEASTLGLSNFENYRFHSDLKFYWHPDMGYEFQPDGYLKVAPTSSTRTVMTLELENNFMIKMDMDKWHFFFVRRLRGASVKHSIDICKDIIETIIEHNLQDYGILTEIKGIIYGDKQQGIGALIREFEPYPYFDNRFCIPYFSLYSSDINKSEDAPLLIQIIEKISPDNPLNYFIETIVGKVQDAFFFFASNRAIFPELHGQNTLLEIDKEGKPTRIIHRDFQSIYSDYELRYSKNLKQFDKHIINIHDQTPLHEQASLVYDYIIGDLLFDKLVKTYSKHYKIADTELSRLIRQRFQERAGLLKEIFPNEIYRFSKKIGVASDKLINTKQAPKFR